MFQAGGLAWHGSPDDSNLGQVTELRVTEAVGEAFPGYLIAAVVASGADGRTPWPGVDAELAAMEAAPPPEDHPHIDSWRDAYRAFGTNPKRQRPSVDALRRRLARNGQLPRITPLVDAYNLVSVTYAVPAGAFDLRAVSGDIEVRFAGGDEEFTPLGEPEVTENPRQGEVIYHDADGVLTRHWNHRDADRTKVTETSTDVVFLMETTDDENFGDLVRQSAADLADRLKGRADLVAIHWLSSATPEAAL
jgi:DNA/RNA-binding domain of Phe-tRNA-synthetase-like protein